MHRLQSQQSSSCANVSEGRQDVVTTVSIGSNCVVASTGEHHATSTNSGQPHPQDKRSVTSGSDFYNDVSASPHTTASSSIDASLKFPAASEADWKRIVCHAFLGLIVCSIDRINLSVAILPMSEQFGWTQSTKGIVQAVFFCGYITTGIIGGQAADRIGGRLVLAGGVAIWSLMTALTPVAAHISLPLLLVIRILLGAGEGVGMPAMNALIKAWVPPGYLSRSIAFAYSGMYFGAILGPLITPPIISAINWEAVFLICGFGGLSWVLLFLLTTKEPQCVPASVNYDSTESSIRKSNIRGNYVTVPNGLEDPETIPEHTVSYLESGEDDTAQDSTGPSGCLVRQAESEMPTLSIILSHKSVWAIIVAHFCTTWGYFVLLMWLPSYLAARFDLDIAHTARLSTFPWIVIFIATHFAGFLADYLIAKKFDVTTVRKLMQGVGALGPALSLTLITFAQTKYFAIACITAALGFSSFSHGGVYCVHQDIAATCAGTLLGISNTFASIPGIIGVGITGIILDHSDNNWNLVFGLAVVFYVIGFVTFTAWGSSQRIFP